MQLAETEKRARLLMVINKKVNGRLSKNELEKIVNTIDVDVQYSILVIFDAKEMAKQLILADQESEHSWAGGDGTKEEGKCILGNNVSFGQDYHYQYFDNGNLTQEEASKTLPDFEITSKLAVVITSNRWDYWDRKRLEEEKKRIVIYLPAGQPYKVDEEIQYILDHFNIGTK